VTTEKPANVTVARILRSHGRRGEVACEILTDFPERLTKLTSVELWNGHSEPQGIVVGSCWLSQSRGRQAIFHFAGIDSISGAEKLVGFEVQIPFNQRMQLPSGSYYISDLIGCEIRDGGDAPVGRVHDVQFTGENVAGTPLLVVESPRGELLIPLAEEICKRIDVHSCRIDVALPEGLLDLNQGS
jgi:16S rRNA processing protein RimM